MNVNWTAVLVAAVFAVAGIHDGQVTERTYIANGYERGTIPGYGDAVWRRGAARDSLYQPDAGGR